jgi:hypothetical protein
VDIVEPTKLHADDVAHLSVTLYRKVRNTRFYILPSLACQRTPADGK